MCSVVGGTICIFDFGANFPFKMNGNNIVAYCQSCQWLWTYMVLEN